MHPLHRPADRYRRDVMSHRVVARSRAGEAASGHRRGVAAVEMALILPILLLVVFGMIQATQVIEFRKQLVAASWEGIRLASQRTATDADVRARVQSVLSSRNVTGSTVTITPSGLTTATAPGTLITVQVSAPFSGMSFVRLGVTNPTTITVTGAILRE